jgi:hypothetical protein
MRHLSVFAASVEPQELFNHQFGVCKDGMSVGRVIVVIASPEIQTFAAQMFEKSDVTETTYTNIHSVVFDHSFQEWVLVLVHDNISTSPVEREHPVVLFVLREVSGSASTFFFTFSEQEIEFNTKLRQDLKQDVRTQAVVQAGMPNDIAFVTKGGRILNCVEMCYAKDFGTTVLVEVQAVRRFRAFPVLPESRDFEVTDSTQRLVLEHGSSSGFRAYRHI